MIPRFEDLGKLLEYLSGDNVVQMVNAYDGQVVHASITVCEQLTVLSGQFGADQISRQCLGREIRFGFSEM